MAWPTKGSGSNYNSHTGVGNAMGGYSKKVLDSHIWNRLCRQCDVARRRNKKVRGHVCIKNWSESSKSMESAAIFEIVVRAPTKGYVVERLCSDDDNVMRAPPP